MDARFERRLAALEARGRQDRRVTVIRLVGHTVAEISQLRAADGQSWTRQPSETERAFIDRASREAARNEWGSARLVGDAASVQSDQLVKRDRRDLQTHLKSVTSGLKLDLIAGYGN